MAGCVCTSWDLPRGGAWARVGCPWVRLGAERRRMGGQSLCSAPNEKHIGASRMVRSSRLAPVRRIRQTEQARLLISRKNGFWGVLRRQKSSVGLLICTGAPACIPSIVALTSATALQACRTHNCTQRTLGCCCLLARPTTPRRVDGELQEPTTRSHALPPAARIGRGRCKKGPLSYAVRPGPVRLRSKRKTAPARLRGHRGIKRRALRRCLC